MKGEIYIYIHFWIFGRKFAKNHSLSLCIKTFGSDLYTDIYAAFHFTQKWEVSSVMGSCITVDLRAFENIIFY